MLTMSEKEILKKNLWQYLLSVLEEEECYNTLEKCREEVRRTQGYLLARGRQLASCASEWLRGLSIGVEYMTWNICKMFFDWLGFEYDPYFSLGKVVASERSLTLTTLTVCTGGYWGRLSQRGGGNEGNKRQKTL